MYKTFKSALADSRFYVGVGRSLSGDVIISVASSSALGLTTAIAPSDAPALALAEMEAAGYTEDDRDGSGLSHFAIAMTNLRLGIAQQARATAEAKERAELEAVALDDAGAVLRKWTANEWYATGDDQSYMNTEIGLPARVLYRPEVKP